MRILHVLTAFPRSRDDVIAPWLVELLRRLRQAGHEVEVFTSAYRGGGNREFEGIPVHRFRYFPARWEDLTHDEAVPDRLKRGLRYRLAVVGYLVGGTIAIWRLCRRRRYDVVHVHWPFPHALFGWVARAACGARLVATFYGVEIRWVKTAMPILKGVLVRAIRSADRVVAISGYTAAELRELTQVDVAVIPYTAGITAPEGVSAGNRSPEFTVLFVGRLVERKGVPILLEAARRLRDVVPVRVIVIGDGPERPRLADEVRRSGLEGVVQLKGQVSADDLGRAYAEAGTLVLPAIVDTRGDTEGLGVVLLEAMSYGVPVIASDIGGIKDIVTHENTGLLVPAGDAAALARAIRRLAEDPGLRRRLGEAGRRRLRENFSWPAIVARWEEVYRQVASGAHAAAPARD